MSIHPRVRPRPRTNERPRELGSGAGVTNAGQRGVSGRRSPQPSGNADVVHRDRAPGSAAQALEKYEATEKEALEAVKRLGRARLELLRWGSSSLPPEVVSATRRRFAEAIDFALRGGSDIVREYLFGLKRDVEEDKR